MLMSEHFEILTHFGSHFETKQNLEKLQKRAITPRQVFRSTSKFCIGRCWCADTCKRFM